MTTMKNSVVAGLRAGYQREICFRTNLLESTSDRGGICVRDIKIERQMGKQKGYTVDDQESAVVARTPQRQIEISLETFRVESFTKALEKMGIGDNMHWPPKPWCQVLQLLLLLVIAVKVTAQTDPCQTNAVLPEEVKVSFSTSRCLVAWNPKTFIVRYDDNATTLSMVVSVTKEKRWYSIGFNKDRSMIGASAMVVWVDSDGTPAIKQYYLGGRSTTTVKIDSKMTFAQNPQAFSTADAIYMAFQIDKVASTDVSFDFQLYAYGPEDKLPVSDQLEQHEFMNVVRFDYTSGTTTGGLSDPSSLRRNHGILNIFGWGILLPVGAIIARHCKRWDPAWFYLHVCLQVIGYILIIAALVLGVRLADKIPNVDFGTHRGLGIFVFALATLQVSAVLIRPKKDAKIRRYWNFYHHWAGRIAFVIAAINVFVGIHVSGGGRKWNASYSLILVIKVIVSAVLEILLCVNRAAEKEPTLQLGGGNFEPNYPNSAPPAYDNYRSQI